MPTLNVTVPIQLDDGEYTVLEQRSGLIKLRSSTSGAFTTMHLAELAQRVIGMEPTSIADGRLLDALSATQQQHTLDLADHLREIITGEHPHVSRPRPQFDPANTTQEQRVQAKLAELEATPYRMARSTLMAKLSAFKKAGETSLIDGRALKGKHSAAQDRQQVIEALCNVIQGQHQVSSGTAERLIRLTQVELNLQHGADAPPLPSQRTMYRLIGEYARNKHTTGSAKTRRSLADRPDRPFSKHVQLLPGAEVQLDSTPLDVLVKVPNSRAQRPTLTIMIDVASRSILAYSFRLVAAKSVDHVGLIAQALTPIQNQPDRSKFRDMVQQQNPGCTLLGSEELSRLAHHRPWVYPRVLVIDNGKDFKSTPTIRAAEVFGMRVIFSPPRTPTTKSIVERMFKTINTMFTQHLVDGYLGRSVEFRGYDIDKSTNLLDIYAVQELFHDWVLNVWQNRPHESLRDPLHPEVHFSPNQMAAAAAATVGTINIPLSPDQYLDLLPTVKRALTSTGFRHANHFYDSPKLHQFRGRETAMVLHHDPYNPSAVWAKAPDGTFIECTIRDWNARNSPFFAEFQPDGTEVAEAEDRLAQRAEVAFVGATLAGTPLHHIATPTYSAPLPEDFDTDDDDAEELSEFDPEGNLS
ncbi:Mu transposase C-terminal domain-containing protein [Cryobacterium sp. MDB2-10]|uniref:Mu transposase C-terminal domain-containing protein n=1 Tax=Cryobacterium sp. MDB2-10 TaxID=1259177 RepID=UPI00143167CE|nr:Mu transposase C-terminal domain-containing protein [Cryobacterium sp. MDB2-10]